MSRSRHVAVPVPSVVTPRLPGPLRAGAAATQAKWAMIPTTTPRPITVRPDCDMAMPAAESDHADAVKPVVPVHPEQGADAGAAHGGHNAGPSKIIKCRIIHGPHHDQVALTRDTSAGAQTRIHQIVSFPLTRTRRSSSSSSESGTRRRGARFPLSIHAVSSSRTPDCAFHPLPRAPHAQVSHSTRKREITGEMRKCAPGRARARACGRRGGSPGSGTPRPARAG